MAQELAAAACMPKDPPLGSPLPTAAQQQQYLPPPPGSPFSLPTPSQSLPQALLSPTQVLPGSPDQQQLLAQYQRPAPAPLVPRSPGAQVGQRQSSRPGSSKGPKVSRILLRVLWAVLVLLLVSLWFVPQILSGRRQDTALAGE